MSGYVGARRCHVAVIGAGVAGTAAAAAAAGAGADVLLLDGGPGASVLATGAVDLVDWQAPSARPPALAREARDVLDALGGYLLPPSGSRLLTTGGVSRPAAGHDAALLDVASTGPGRIGVVRCERPGWDASALARAWGSRFEAIDATVLRRTDERALPDTDFAGRHDDAERLAWLGERLREALAVRGGEFDAIALPPSLGLERARAADLSAAVGVPCGEVLALPGGPSGLRFLRARDRLLSALRIEPVRARADAIEASEHGWRITSNAGTFEAPSIVVAMGGLLGGGIEYCPSDAVFATALPPRAQAPLRLTVAIARDHLQLGARGRPLEVPGSLFGVAPEALAWPFADDPLLERAGVLVDRNGAAGVAGLFGAGEMVADAARTWLEALASGVRAGTAAAAAIAPAGAASARRP